MEKTESRAIGQTEPLDEDIERMARQRAEIEEELEERKGELAKIGDFGQARCIEFDCEGGWAGDSEHLVFVFQFPDGDTEKVPFGLSNETKSLESFMESYGASSVTDMIGSTHGCIYTDRGWQLHRKQSPNPRMYYSAVQEHGDLVSIYWIPFVVAILITLYGAIGQISPVITTIIAGVIFFYGLFRTLCDIELQVR